MGALPERVHMTIEEFEQLPDSTGIQELLDGEMVQVPPPKSRHSVLVQSIYELLRRHVDPLRIFVEAGFLIGDHCLQPDLAVNHPNQPLERGWFAGAPMVAIEVASRGNTPDQLEFKKETYLASGAEEVWLVFEKTRTVQLFGRGGLNRTYRDLVRSEALVIEASVEEIFE